MTDEELEALEERERQARASSDNLEKGERLAKSIAAESKKQVSLQNQITDYLNAPKPTAGTIKQFIEAPFSNLNVIDAIHQANAKENIGVQEYIETVAKAHAKNVRDNIATMFSGKDYMGERKNYKNIFNQAGMKNDALTSDFVKKTKWLPNTPTILGLAGDIASDPMNAVPVTPIFNAVKNIGKFGIEMASKAPKIEKGINALRSRLNLFHDIEKTMPAEDVAKFKQGVQEWIATGKTSMLESLGYDMRKYVNTKAGSNVTDPATKANYKFKGTREFVQDTAELLKAKGEYTNSIKEIDAAKKHLAGLKLAEQYPAASKTSLNTLWNKSGNVRKAIDAELAAKHAEKEMAARAARTTNAAKNTKAIANAEAEVMRLEKIAQEKAAKSTSLTEADRLAQQSKVPGRNVSEKTLYKEVKSSKNKISNAHEDISLLNMAIEDEQQLLATLTENLTTGNALLYARTQKNLTKLQKKRSVLYKRIDQESTNIITMDNIGKGVIGPHQPGIDARLVGDTQVQFSAKTTKAQAEAQAAYAKVEEAKRELLRLKGQAAGPAITDATPKTLKAPAKLAGDIDVGSYKFVREIANKNLADLNPTEIKELEAMLVQWKSIATNNPHQRGSFLKKFAEDTLPLLQSGKLTQGPKGKISDAEKTLNDLLAASEIKKQKLDKATAAAKVTKKGYDDYYKVLDEIAEPAAPKTKAGKVADKYIGGALDLTSGAFKRLMSWSPIFQTRNAISGMFRGMTEGSTLRNYWDALPFARNTWGGKTTKPLENTAEFTSRYKTPESALKDQLQAGGAMSQTGMYEQPLSRLPGKVANFFETWNRTALVLADIGKGKGTQQALEHSMKAFYQYSRKTMTPFEKQFLQRIDPFLAFDKYQILYMPNALAENKNWYNIAAKLKEGTKPESEKENPLIVPDYRKDQFSLGSVGNFGFQAEDFLRLAMLDWKTAYSKTAQAIKLITEGTLDYNIFSGKQISKDNKAGQYANLPEPMRKLLGYDQDDNTVDPWMKWMMGIMAGPLMKPILNSVDPKKDAWSVITSAREYDTSEKNMLMHDRMNQRAEASGGFWENNRFSGNDLVVGPRVAGATTTTAQPVLIQGIKPSVIEAWRGKNNNADYFNTPLKVDSSDLDREKVHRYRQGYLIDATKQNQTIQTTDIVANAWRQWKNYDALYAGKEVEPGVGKEGADLLRAGNTANYYATAPRKVGQGYFSVEQLMTNIALGNDKMEIAYNMSQKTLSQILSKIAETYRNGQDSSPEAARLTLESGLDAARTQLAYAKVDMKTPGGQALLDKIQKSLEYQYQTTMQKLAREVAAAQADTLGNYADAEIEGMNRIQAEKQAAIAKYAASEQALKLKNDGQMEDYNNGLLSIAAKYDRKLQEQGAKDARILAETMGNVLKDTMTNTLAYLKSTYERGGLTAEQYAEKQKEVILKKANDETVNWIRATIKEFEAVKATQIAQTPLTWQSPSTGIKEPRKPKQFYKPDFAGETLTGKIIDVHDGDTATLDLGKGNIKKIRLANIDAPELDQKFGPEAQRALADIILNKMVSVKITDVDKYKRSVGEVTVGDTNVNLEMVKKALAEVFSSFIRDAKTFETYSKAQIAQQQARAGIWSQGDQYQSPGSFRKGIKLPDAPATGTTSLSQTTKPQKGVIYTIPDYPDALVTWDGTMYHLQVPEALFEAKTIKTISDKYLTKGGFDVIALDPSKATAVARPVDNTKNIAAVTDITTKLAAIAEKVSKTTDLKEREKLVSEAVAMTEKGMKEHLGNVTNLGTELKGVANEANALQKGFQGVNDELIKNREQLRNALIELTDSTKKLQVEILHIQATTPSGLTLDRSMRPQWRTPDISEMVKAADASLQQEKDNALKSRAQSLSKSLAGVSGYIGAVGTNADGSENRDNLGLLKFDETNGNSEKYMADVKAMTDAELVKTQIMAAAEKNKTDVVTQGTQDRLNVLTKASQAINAEMQASAAQQVSIEQAAAQKRLSIAGDMASMLGQTASMIYEASGKKSKEAFYVMKAVAMAEAMIKGTQTIISAMAAGASIGGPAAIATSAAFGAIAAAMVGAQIGIIAAQTVAGPGKAEGGPIEGGSGTKDDVPILAMGGEFVIKKSSTQKYGAAFLDALNKGLIPVSDLNFNIPASASPSYGQTHFGEGGMVASRMEPKDIKKDESQNVQIVNVIDPQLLDKYLASNAGQKTLVNVLAANRYELQQIMR